MTLQVLILFVVVVAIALLVVSALLAPHRADAEKRSSYETGLVAILGQTRTPFTLAYYVVAVLFLLFDLELAFTYPIAVSLETLGLYGYWILTMFFGLLTLGFVLEIGTGALDLTSGATSINPKRPS